MKTRCFYRTEQKDVYDRYRNPNHKPLDARGKPNRDNPVNKAYWEGYLLGTPYAGTVGGLEASPHHDGSLEHSAFLAGWDVGEDEAKLFSVMASFLAGGDVGEDEARANPGTPDISSVKDFIESFSKLGKDIKELIDSPQAAFDMYHAGGSIWQKVGGRWHEVNIAKDTRNNIHKPSLGLGRYLGPLVETSLVDPRK